MANSLADRRKYNRKSIDTVVDIKLLIDGELYVDEGRVRDISVGGLKFESCHKLSQKEVVISFCNGPFLAGTEVKSRVTRMVKDGLTYLYGVEFKGLKLREKTKIWYMVNDIA